MKHLLLLITTLALAALGTYVVAINVRTETIPILSFGGGCWTLALLLAFPTDTVAAFQAVAPYLPFARRNTPNQ